MSQHSCQYKKTEPIHSSGTTAPKQMKASKCYNKRYIVENVRSSEGFKITQILTPSFFNGRFLGYHNFIKQLSTNGSNRASDRLDRNNYQKQKLWRKRVPSWDTSQTLSINRFVSCQVEKNHLEKLTMTTRTWWRFSWLYETWHYEIQRRSISRYQGGRIHAGNRKTLQGRVQDCQNWKATTVLNFLRLVKKISSPPQRCWLSIRRWPNFCHFNRQFKDFQSWDTTRSQTSKSLQQ